MLLEVLAFFVQNPVNKVLVASSACEVLLKSSATNQLYLLFSALERLETIENTRLRCVKRCAATCSSLQDVLQDVLQYVLRDMLQDVLQENVSKSMVCGQSDVLHSSVGSGRFCLH